MQRFKGSQGLKTQIPRCKGAKVHRYKGFKVSIGHLKTNHLRASMIQNIPFVYINDEKKVPSACINNSKHSIYVHPWFKKRSMCASQWFKNNLRESMIQNVPSACIDDSNGSYACIGDSKRSICVHRWFKTRRLRTSMIQKVPSAFIDDSKSLHLRAWMIQNVPSTCIDYSKRLHLRPSMMPNVPSAFIDNSKRSICVRR